MFDDRLYVCVCWVTRFIYAPARLRHRRQIHSSAYRPSQRMVVGMYMRLLLPAPPNSDMKQSQIHCLIPLQISILKPTSHKSLPPPLLPRHDLFLLPFPPLLLLRKRATKQRTERLAVRLGRLLRALWQNELLLLLGLGALFVF
jgi:hypothetical protein